MIPSTSNCWCVLHHFRRSRVLGADRGKSGSFDDALMVLCRVGQIQHRGVARGGRLTPVLGWPGADVPHMQTRSACPDGVRPEGERSAGTTTRARHRPIPHSCTCAAGRSSRCGRRSEPLPHRLRAPSLPLGSALRFVDAANTLFSVTIAKTPRKRSSSRDDFPWH